MEKAYRRRASLLLSATAPMPSLRRTASLTIGALFVGAQFVAAQSVPGVEAEPEVETQAPVSGQLTPPVPSNRPPGCDGCPPRRLGRSFLVVTVVNGFYEMANLIRGQDTAKITPETWWTNMKRGWEWDLDDFTVNQIGHPYQGNNYFTSGRANGLNFWESAALTAFGSGTWEYFGETNQASLNDFINTTLGGIALGEMFHRTAWLVRDPTKSGKSRTRGEILATVLDPMTGVTRFISGDSSRVTEKPADMVPSGLEANTSFGMLWRGSNTESIESKAYGFFETDLLYGDFTTGESHTPYDAFSVRLSFGGGSAFSEARVRGRLFSGTFHGTLITVSQDYQYNKNPAYQFGAQAVATNFSYSKQLSSHNSMFLAGWGGVTILGAIDSIPLGGKVEVPVDPEAGQGVSTGPRYYDYGPGGNLGAFFTIRRDNRPLLNIGYELHHLHILDGVRANHMLQRIRGDFMLPLKGRLGIGTTGEFFERKTFYDDNQGIGRYRFPQYRVYLTWSQ
jgi:hypothetical protein